MDFFGVAIDASGNAWTIHEVAYPYSATFGLFKVLKDGTFVGGTNGYTGGGMYFPSSLVIDGAGNVWIVNQQFPAQNAAGDISEFSSAGSPISPPTGYIGPAFSSYPGALVYPEGLAIDGSGDVWITNTYSSQIVEFIGAATPVITPIVAGLPATPTADGSSKLGTRP
jgi:hypothetical protein